MSDTSFRSYQADLRTETLSTIIVFSLAIGYIWLWLNIWTVTGSNTPISGWFGSLLLVGIGLTSNALKKVNLRATVYLLIAGIFITTISAFYTLHSPATPYLFILPIAFTSVLLSRQMVFLEALIASGVILTSLAGSPDAWVAIITLWMVALSSFLSARNLYITLAWLSDAYERARLNEHIARERQAELRRLLKALDDATQKLERANQRLIIERNEAESALMQDLLNNPGNYYVNVHNADFPDGAARGQLG